MRKYTVGIIGYGGFGRFLHYWWSKLDNIEVVAIADSGKHYQYIENCRTYNNWKELIENPEIDIVSIVTPPGLHAEMACAAMLAGKHVLLEKPVALNEESAAAILKTQLETGKVITVDHMIRYNPIIQNFMHLGRRGIFGKLRHVVVNNYAQDEALPADHWFWDREVSGGIFIEHGVHFFDIVNALGEQHFKEVHGISTNRNESQRDRVAATVLYDDGLIASFYHAFSGPGLFEQTTIQLAYDLARVEIEGWMPMKGTIKALVNEQNKEQLKGIPGLKINHSETLDSLKDVSRPEGWGSADGPGPLNNHSINAGGIDCDVSEMLSATFGIEQTKGEVYGKCVQSILLDMIQKIENNDHKLTVRIEDAIEGLKIAVLASK